MFIVLAVTLWDAWAHMVSKDQKLTFGQTCRSNFSFNEIGRFVCLGDSFSGPHAYSLRYVPKLVGGIKLKPGVPQGGDQ